MGTENIFSRFFAISLLLYCIWQQVSLKIFNVAAV